MTPIRLRAVAVLVTATATLIASAAFAEAKTSAPATASAMTSQPRHPSPVRPTAKRLASHTDTGSPKHADAPAAGSATTCSYRETVVLCHDPALGWWNSDDNCYWNLVSPQPPPGDPLWIGHTQADGKLYTTTCEQPDGLGVGVLGVSVAFSSQPPPGYNGIAAVGNYLLAMNAMATLPILGPPIHTAPSSGGAGLVGLPVWMWSDSSLLTWGPIDLGLPIGLLGLGLSIHALGQRIDWYMGDGHDVVCSTVGTAYTGVTSQYTSPSCGYTYSQPSVHQPGGHYTITAAATWSINWTIGVDSGSLTVVRATTSQITIDELQVVNQ